MDLRSFPHFVMKLSEIKFKAVCFFQVTGGQIFFDPNTYINSFMTLELDGNSVSGMILKYFESFREAQDFIDEEIKRIDRGTTNRRFKNLEENVERLSKALFNIDQNIEKMKNEQNQHKFNLYAAALYGTNSMYEQYMVPIEARVEENSISREFETAQEQRMILQEEFSVNNGMQNEVFEKELETNGEQNVESVRYMVSKLRNFQFLFEF